MGFRQRYECTEMNEAPNLNRTKVAVIIEKNQKGPHHPLMW